MLLESGLVDMSCAPVLQRGGKLADLCRLVEQARLLPYRCRPIPYVGVAMTSTNRSSESRATFFTIATSIALIVWASCSRKKDLETSSLGASEREANADGNEGHLTSSPQVSLRALKPVPAAGANEAASKVPTDALANRQSDTSTGSSTSTGNGSTVTSTANGAEVPRTTEGPENVGRPAEINKSPSA